MYGVVGALACGGGGNDGMNPPPAATLDHVTVSSTTVALAAGAAQLLTAEGRSAAGAVIGGVAFTWSSGNPSVAAVTPAGRVIGLTAGTATIMVTGASGSVTRSATSAVTVTGVLASAIVVVAGSTTNDFTPNAVGVARGGTVTWQFGELVHDVTFQGGTAGAPANIPATSNSAGVIRQFNTAGRFDYLCTLHSGQSGTVAVP